MLFNYEKQILQNVNILFNIFIRLYFLYHFFSFNKHVMYSVKYSPTETLLHFKELEDNCILYVNVIYSFAY